MDPLVLDGQDLELRTIAAVDALLASGTLRAAAEAASGRLR